MINLGIEMVPALKKNPLAFNFTNNNTALVNTLTEVSTTPRGFEGWVTATVTGNDAQLRRNNTGSWGSSVMISNGDLLNLRMTSSSSNDTDLECIVTIGAISTQWTLRTIVDPAIVLTNVTNAPISQTFTQTPVNHSNVPLTFSITGGTVSNNNVSFGSSAVVAAGATFYVRQTSSANHATLTTATLTVLGTINYNWTITTATVVPTTLTLTANQNYTIPPYDTLIITMWGAGGGSGDYQSYQINPTDVLFGDVLIAGSGKKPVNSTAAGIGGQAFGGDINDDGNNGLSGGYGGGHPQWNYAPHTNGGTQGAGRGSTAANYYDQNGNLLYTYTYSDGGAGAYCKKTYEDNALPEGSVVNVSIGKAVLAPGYSFLDINNLRGGIGQIDIEILKDGQRDFTANTGFTIPTYTSSLTIRMWGPGGVGYNYYIGYNVDGYDTKIVSQGLTAGRGVMATYNNTNSGTTGTLGGTATGGTTNTSGNQGLPNNNTGGTVAAPNSNVWGRGGAGGLTNGQASGSGPHFPSGGSGSYLEKTYTLGQLTPGNSLILIVGKSGTNQYQPASSGADGHIQIIWD